MQIFDPLVLNDSSRAVHEHIYMLKRRLPTQKSSSFSFSDFLNCLKVFLHEDEKIIKKKIYIKEILLSTECL